MGVLPLKEIDEGVMRMVYVMILSDPYNFDITSNNHCTNRILKNSKILKIELSEGIIRARCKEAVKFCEDSIPLEELRKKRKGK